MRWQKTNIQKQIPVYIVKVKMIKEKNIVKNIFIEEKMIFLMKKWFSVIDKYGYSITIHRNNYYNINKLF